MIYLRFIFAILIACLLIACGSGSSSSSNPVATSVQTTDMSDIPQIAMPQLTSQEVIHMGYSTSVSMETLKTSLQSQSYNANTVQTTNECLSITNYAPSASSGAWYFSASFKVTNSCQTPQSASGLQLVFSASQSLNPASFTLNSVSFNPWAATSASAIGMSGNADAIIITLNTTAVVAPNSSAPGSFGYSLNGTALTNTNLVVNGATPVQKAALNASIDTSPLTSVCTSSSPCNIAINLVSASGSINNTIATITNSNLGLIDANVTGLIPGQYSVTSSGLPSNATMSVEPSAALNLTAGNVSTVLIKFKTQDVGSIAFTLTNPNSALFADKNLTVNATQTSSSMNISATAKLNQQTVISNLVGGQYTLSAQGLASASSAKYYKFANKSAVVQNAQTTNLGNWSTTEQNTVVTDKFVINGLKAGDTITFNFTDINGYVFNQESIKASSDAQITANYSFLLNDKVTVTTTVNSSYEPVAPFTFTQGSNTASYSINLTAPNVKTSGVINFHYYFGVSPMEPQDSINLTGDRYTDLIMSNAIAGAMYGHLITKYTPGMQFNKDYLYGSIFGQLLQENLATQLYDPASSLIDSSPDQQSVMGAGQGGPYQINYYAADMVSGGYAPAGFSLINYVAIQKNIGFTMANAAQQYAKPTPPSFNNKYYGPIATAYFHFNDYKSLMFVGGTNLTTPWNPSSYGWTPPWQPNYYNGINTFKTLPNNFLDIISNVAYNQGFYGALFTKDVAQMPGATATTVAQMDSFSNAWKGDTYAQYPYQVRSYMDQVYNIPSPSTSNLSNIITTNNIIAFNMTSLGNIFSSVFQTLAYIDGSNKYVYISADQAGAAFKQAMTNSNIAQNAILNFSSSSQRAQIFKALEDAIKILENNLNTDFTATTNSQL